MTMYWINETDAQKIARLELDAHGYRREIASLKSQLAERDAILKEAAFLLRASCKTSQYHEWVYTERANALFKEYAAIEVKKNG